MNEDCLDNDRIRRGGDIEGVREVAVVSVDNAVVVEVYAVCYYGEGGERHEKEEKEIAPIVRKQAAHTPLLTVHDLTFTHL